MSAPALELVDALAEEPEAEESEEEPAEDPDWLVVVVAPGAATAPTLEALALELELVLEMELELEELVELLLELLVDEVGLVMLDAVAIAMAP